MASFVPNIWNTLSPRGRASVLANKPQTEEDILAGFGSAGDQRVVRLRMCG